MKSTPSLPIVAGACLALFCVSVLAFAPMGGRVTKVVGSADIQRESATLQAEKGGYLQSGDQLMTPVDSRLQWWMEDDSMAAIASSTQAQIRRFEPEANEATYSLRSGGMRILSGSIQPRVLTPRATIDATGADFTTVVCDKRCGEANGEIYVLVTSGSARVYNPEGSVSVSAGEYARVASPPSIVLEVPASVLKIALEMQLDVEVDGDLIPELPLQPLPVIEQPGSPS